LESLLAHKVRALLSTIGVVIGSASTVLVITVALTGSGYIVAQIEGIGSNIVYAEHIGRQPSSGVSDEVTLADLDAVRNEVPDVVDVAASHDTPVSIVAEARQRRVALVGVTSGFQRIRRLVLVRGRYFDEDEIARSVKVCLLTEELAAAMFPEREAIGEVARIGDLRLAVVGVFRERVSTFGASELQRETAIVPLPL